MSAPNTILQITIKGTGLLFGYRHSKPSCIARVDGLRSKQFNR
ncbi:Protein of unknown function [Pyronema omphalodes CBS 100304]|uniref:Uncharacterized protein n=1 Tax=Pyronema omphalodes (strain CBS 100304) TaxID=1076935 RepID=U4LVP0_PYROM|nr:Protein of unknown function [Pyronema omphalodes CBS 100304]